MRKLKTMTLYRANMENYSPYADYYNDLGVYHGKLYLCLGEITNTPNHYAFVVSGGKVVYGLHDNIFEEIEE